MLGRLRRKNLHTWLPSYARDLIARAGDRRFRGPRHLLFAFCDHYEPLWGRADRKIGERRVDAWRKGYPEMARDFRDADGRPPRHSFFFPGEEYQPEYLEQLAELARAGFGEVELHLHHDGDNAANLRHDVARYLEQFARHGHISRDASGAYRFAFIHGNWCLANARRDGRWCGVDEELPLLHAAGCYADYTFPSAPDECQPGIINRIYWPEGDLSRRRAYQHGVRARVGDARSDRILMIEGPLALARRPGGLALRIENAAVTAHDPGSSARVRTWVDQAICVDGRPEWVFVKVHTHGAPEPQAASLLGDGGRALHRALAGYNDGVRWKLHYVTAREMFNVATAALAGRSGDPAQHFDATIAPPPVAVQALR